MNWRQRIIAISVTTIVAGVFVVIIPKSLTQWIHGLTEWLTGVLNGSAGLEGIFKLGIYVIAITLIIRFLYRR